LVAQNAVDTYVLGKTDFEAALATARASASSFTASISYATRRHGEAKSELLQKSPCDQRFLASALAAHINLETFRRRAMASPV
jgi:hypothetical protein